MGDRASCGQATFDQKTFECRSWLVDVSVTWDVAEACLC